MKLNDDLPRWVMWPLRSVFYALVLYIVFAIAQSVASAKLQSNIEQCLADSRILSGSQTQNRIERLRDCLSQRNGFLENLATSPGQKAIDALSHHPSEFAGSWDSTQPNCHYRYLLTESGEYTAQPVQCSLSSRRFTGTWGILDNQMVWLHDSSSITPFEFNPIEASNKDAFVIVENDGSRTTFTRVVEKGEALAKSELPTEEPVKPAPLPEGASRLPFGSVAPHPGAIAISSDGNTVAHIALNGDVEIWDPIDEKALEVIPANGKQPGALAISDDGKLVAIGHFDSQVTVWSHVKRKVEHQFNGASGAISSVAFSRDGKLLAVGSDDGTASLWELGSVKPLRIFDSIEGGAVVGLGFAGNGKALVVNEWYSRQYDVGRGTTIWDLVEGIEISTREVAPPNGDNGLRAGQALGGKGWLLAYTGNDGLMVERLDSCTPPIQLPTGGYADTVISDSQGRWVAAAEGEKLTFFATTGDRSTQSVTLPGKAIAFAPLPDGHSVLALMIDETRFNGNERFIVGRDADTITKGALYRIQVPEPYWKMSPMAISDGATHCPPSEKMRNLQAFKIPQKPTELVPIAKLVPTKEMTTDPANPTGEYNKINPPRGLHFGPNNILHVLYHARNDFRSGAAVWDLQTQSLLRSRLRQYVGDLTLRLKEGWGARSQESQSGTLQTEKLEDLLTGNPLFVVQDVDTQKFSTTIVDPDTGDLFWCESGYFRRYAADGRRLGNVKTNGIAVAYAARNGKLAALYLNGTVQVWQLGLKGNSKTYDLRLDNESVMSAGDMALSADGRYLRVVFANGSGDGPDVYSVYDLRSTKAVGDGALLAPFPGHSNRGIVADVRGHRLAVWDFDKAAMIARLPRHPVRGEKGATQSLQVAISDDGRLVASGSFDGLIRIWDIDTRQMMGEGHAGGEIASIAFDPTASQLAVGKGDGEIAVFRVPSPVR